MIKLINCRTKSAMWVADERVEEYLAAGHKLAAVPCAKPEKAEKIEKVEKKTETAPKRGRKKKGV